MNSKKLIALLLTGLLLICVLAGCSDASTGISTDYEMGEAPMVSGNSGSLSNGIYDSSDTKAPAVTDRKLIRKIS